MLRYVGTGKRPYGDSPIPVHSRLNWEFQAVLRGKLAPITKERVPLETATLWTFPPGYEHGWRGDKGRDCEIVVFHFSGVAESIRVLAKRHGYLRARLGAREVARLRSLSKSLARHYWQPRLFSDLYADRALAELSLIIGKAYAEAREPRPMGAAFSRVTAAEAWIRTHLAQSPSMKDAAKAVGTSASQLGRLFAKVRGESPGRFLIRAKLEKAMDLLANSRLKLETVAGQCGFSSASYLCRAFKEYRGSSPTHWRRETLIHYRSPRPDRAEDPGAHGRRDRRGI